MLKKILAIFSFSLGCIGTAQVLAETLRLELDWIPSVEFAGIFVASEKGWYREEGIDLIFNHRDLNMIARVVSGESDIGMDSAPNLIAQIAKGAPIKAFAAQYQLNPNSILTKRDPKIRSISDLRGKKLGIFAPQDRDMFRVMLGHHGLHLEDVTLVPMTSFKESDIISQLKKGAVDAMIAWEFNWSISFTLLGYEPKVFPGHQNGFDFYGINFFARPEFIETHSKLLARFLRATIRGWTEVYRNPTAYARLVVNKFYPPERYINGSKDLTTRQQILELKLRRRYFYEGVGEKYWGYMTDFRWQKSLDIAKRYQLIDKHVKLKPRDLYDPQVLSLLYPKKSAGRNAP